MGELRWVESTRGSLALDDRAFPVLFATWVGHADEKTVRAFYAWNDVQLKRVALERTAFALITDAVAAERPDAPVRALLAELTRAMQKDHPTAETFRASSIVVLESPFVRGALTAVGWLMGGMETEYAPTCAEALQRSESRFRDRGAKWPVGLTPSGYVRATKK
jgi:hypothetical protein